MSFPFSHTTFITSPVTISDCCLGETGVPSESIDLVSKGTLSILSKPTVTNNWQGPPRQGHPTQNQRKSQRSLVLECYREPCLYHAAIGHPMEASFGGYQGVDRHQQGILALAAAAVG